jgi:hypothetical protein
MHHILVLNNDLRSGVQSYIDTKGPKRYQKIAASGLSKIKEGDILYVSAHGYHSKDEKSALNEIQTNKEDMKPDRFCEYLIQNKLPNVGMKLKIFACFSAGLTQSDSDTLNINKSFAGQVASLLHKTHNQITVYGYLEELKFGPVLDGHKSGGTRLNDPKRALFRAKDKRYEFALDGSIIGPEGAKLKLKEQRWS